jgi:3-deoxy-D-manno-octulosonic-acid transferase
LQYGIYQVISWLFYLVAFPLFSLYSLVSGRHGSGLGERLGRVTPQIATGQTPRIWIHAASVGEVQAARALIPALHKEFPQAALVVSTMTEQGRNRAREDLGQIAECIYAPLDLGLCVRKSLRTVRPDIYICLETELWPTFIRQAADRGTPLFLLNARLSEKSFGRYCRFRKLAKDILGRFTAIAAITTTDGERFRALGAPANKITVLGNAKYDRQDAMIQPEAAERCRQLLRVAGDQPVLVAGSTHGGEEKILLEAFTAMRNSSPDMILVLAPRHLNRLESLATLLMDHGVLWQRWTAVKKEGRKAPIILLDTMGELTTLYGAATLVFCGGSLVDKGGHNILEAAAWGKPVFYGPHMQDFADARAILEAAGAGFTVHSATELATAALALLQSPEQYAAVAEQARQAVYDNQGAAANMAGLVKNSLAV